MHSYTILVLLLVASLASSQQCLDPNGTPVAWWVQLIFPGTVPGGFGYIDSTFVSSQFTIHNQAQDSKGTPLWNTFNQINTMSLQTIAWND